MNAKAIQAQIHNFIEAVLKTRQSWALSQNDALGCFFSNLKFFFELLSEFETSVA